MRSKLTRNGMLLAALIATAPLAAAANPCAPKGKNPCAANPCAPKGKNPCAPKGKNPCAANPCAASDRIDTKLVKRPAGTKLAKGNAAELLKEGEALWNSTKLSTNGMSCQTCHQGNGAFAPSFAKPYPHQVAMAKDRAGMKTIALDEMVQVCMVAPMAAKPLPWDSRELAALTAYTAKVQKSFKPSKSSAANPCAAGNPCAPKKNPCAPGNPCAPRK